MNREALKYVISQFTERELPPVRARDLAVPMESGKVVCLVGVRRSGKTFLMYDMIRRLTEAGIDRRQILYLNFEDDRLYPVAAEELDLVLRAHTELYPEAAAQPRYVFLDEMQDVPEWARYVRRLYDTEQVHLFVTGSSSKMLTRDLAPALRGRSLSFEVFPLSFAEFIRFRGLSHKPYDRMVEAQLTRALEDYVAWGGLPEIVLADESLRPLILEEYAALLFFRDLLERYGVRNERVMKLLLKYCSSRPAMLLSVNKLHGDFRSQGLSVSKNTLYEYLEYLKDAYILFAVPKHDASVAKQEQNPRKVHLIDTALTRAFSPHPDRDLRHKLENVVFLHERRKSREVYYYSNAHEVDLYRTGEDGDRFVNVTWSLSELDARRREEAAMVFGAERYPEAQGMLVAHDVGEETSSQASPQPVPAWRYLLGVE